VIKIRLTFHGGASEVGRSCINLNSDGYSVLMDCGIKLTPDEPEYPSLPERVDSFILSHAHLDHCGMVPALYKQFLCPLYGTDLSFDISHILQKDSLKITLSEGLAPEYDYDDIGLSSMGENPVGYNERVELNNKLSFELFDAGHIPGSASVLLDVMENGKNRRVLYTGDIKTSDTRLLDAATVPEADILICESTYGNRVHPDRKGLEKSLLAGVEKTLDGGGNAVLASFALGRTQELLLILDDLNYPVYLDGMGADLTKLMLQYPHYLKDSKALRKAVSNVLWLEHNGMRKQAIKEPSIIVSTAGMLTGGPIWYYLKKLYRDARSTLFLTGYQVEGTNGRLLLDEGYVVDPRGGERLDLRMNVEYLDFSAHAGRHSLERMIEKINPDKCILVHGDSESCASLGEFTEGLCETFIPEVGSSIEL
jgi:putative mRNA 3-end processing factor